MKSDSLYHSEDKTTTEVKILKQTYSPSTHKVNLSANPVPSVPEYAEAR